MDMFCKVNNTLPCKNLYYHSLIEIVFIERLGEHTR